MRKSIDSSAVLLMILNCCIWGSQQAAIKSIAGLISPMMQVSIRSLLSALLLLVLFNARDNILRRLGERQILIPAVCVGLLFTMEFLLVASAIRITLTSHITLFLYTAPVFSAIGLHFLEPEERMSRLQWMGIGLAIIGIMVAVRFTGGQSRGGEWSLWGDMLAIFAGMSWGMTNIIIRRSGLAMIPSSCTLFYQLLPTGVLLLAVALISGQAAMVLNMASVSSMAFQTIVVAFLSYLLWFSLLRRYQVSTLGAFILMTPVMGIAAGVLFLHEPLYGDFILGAILILSGLLLMRTTKTKAPVYRAQVDQATARQRFQ